MRKTKLEDYNNSDIILKRNIEDRSLRFYVHRTRTLQKVNFTILLITAVICVMSSYVLIVKQQNSKLYLTGVDGRIFEYNNNLESAQRIKKVRDKVVNNEK